MDFVVPLSEEELDALLPGEAEGYKIFTRPESGGSTETSEGQLSETTASNRGTN